MRNFQSIFLCEHGQYEEFQICISVPLNEFQRYNPKLLEENTTNILN